MYLDYYGLKREPFSITPDPRYLLYTPRHREAMDLLLYGITQRKGFTQITGEVGSGKTTLCRALLEQLDEQHYDTALILNPAMDEAQLLRTILAELGVHAPASDRVELLDRLNHYLLDQLERGRDVVVIIDEAQNMSLQLLEQLRLISNLETDQRKLVQIVLFGQPELRTLLNDHRLRQLRQRITVRYHLQPLTQNEIAAYIQHRLSLSGAQRQVQFARSALRRIFRYTRGTPRLVNAVCDRTLLAGFVRGVDTFTGREVKLAIRDLEGLDQ